MLLSDTADANAKLKKQQAWLQWQLFAATDGRYRESDMPQPGSYLAPHVMPPAEETYRAKGEEEGEHQHQGEGEYENGNGSEQGYNNYEDSVAEPGTEGPDYDGDRDEDENQARREDPDLELGLGV